MSGIENDPLWLATMMTMSIDDYLKNFPCRCKGGLCKCDDTRRDERKTGQRDT